MINSINNVILVGKIFLNDKSTLKKMMWVLVSFSLSLAFVLSNIGLMEGYDRVFRQGLRETQGDITIISKDGFFRFNEDQESELSRIQEIGKINFTIQSEVFFIFNEKSKAVQMRSIQDESTNSIKHGEIVLGESLAKEWGIRISDDVALMFPRGNTLEGSLPEVKNFRVVGYKKHKLYVRDSRTVYLSYKDAEEMTNSIGKYNFVSLGIKDEVTDEKIQLVKDKIMNALGTGYNIRPFWYEFSGLLEAVKVEKNIITFALQLIVLVAMFNMTSFFRVLFESNYQSLFLLRSLGLSLNSIKLFLLFFSFCLWLIANIGAKILTIIFGWLLNNWSLLQLPGKIYHLAQMELFISIKDLILVAVLSLMWVLILWFWFSQKIGKSQLISVLKGEWR